MTPDQIKIADKLGATQYCVLDDGSILLVTYICGIMFINRVFYGEDRWLIATNNQNRIWSKGVKVIDFGGIE